MIDFNNIEGITVWRGEFSTEHESITVTQEGMSLYEKIQRSDIRDLSISDVEEVFDVILVPHRRFDNHFVSVDVPKIEIVVNDKNRITHIEMSLPDDLDESENPQPYSLKWYRFKE